MHGLMMETPLLMAFGNEDGVEDSKPSKIYFNDGAGRFEDSGQDLGDTEPSGNSVDLFVFQQQQFESPSLLDLTHDVIERSEGS